MIIKDEDAPIEVRLHLFFPAVDSGVELVLFVCVASLSFLFVVNLGRLSAGAVILGTENLLSMLVGVADAAGGGLPLFLDWVFCLFLTFCVLSWFFCGNVGKFMLARKACNLLGIPCCCVVVVPFIADCESGDWEWELCNGSGGGMSIK